MRRPLRFPSRRLVTSVALLAVLGQASADDRDLLKFRAAKPYLFILLDTSASMNLKIGENVSVPGHGDDPASRIWGAKEALFQVFRDVEDVHFGFAVMNQDGLRVPTYHWLYYLQSVPNGWPLQGSGAPVVWPVPDPDGLTTDLITVDVNGDGTPEIGDGVPDNDVEGDALVFGTSFRDDTGALIPGGTCAAPLPLDTEKGRMQVNAFAKTGAAGNEVTTIWFSVGKGGSAKIYRLQIDRPGNRSDGSPNSNLGSDNMLVKFALAGPITSCSSVPTPTSYNFNFRLDPALNRFVMVDRGVDGFAEGNSPSEQTAALWPWSDANDDMDCGDAHPFTGKGWEGNYDSGVGAAGSTFSDEDKHCVIDPESGAPVCVELRPVDQTTLSTYGRPMDRGDVLPFDWREGGDNRDLMLQRLAPNWPDEIPNFGVAAHLTAGPGATGSLEPRFLGRPPLVARNDTPFNLSINDVRCWYMGKKGRNANGKCGQSPYFSEDGWSTTACVNDPDYGCRRPFLIVISDGHDVCKGEDATSDVSDLSEFSGMKTWGLNLGNPQGCRSGGGLHSVVTPGDGECVNVSSKEDLKEVLKGLLAEVREQARSFATAAVPSVQATSDQAIYVSSFTPLNLKSVWDGHVNAFLKPMPVDSNGSPDTTVSCGSGVEAGCHLWDAGVATASQVNAADFLGNNTGQRRVSYPLFQTGGAVPRTNRLFDPVNCSGSPPAASCTDLLKGFGIPYDVSSTSSMTAAGNAANAIITKTLSLKSHVLKNLDGSDGPTIQFVLGDLFHSNPVVVGSPVNVAYWAADTNGDGSECKLDDSGNRGYRCFYERHRFRRKVLFAGADDGMLHAFDAGRFREGGSDPATGRSLDHEFDNGTGHELFALVPRRVLPTLRRQSEGTAHQYGVDGTPVAADVFIDPVHNGTPVADDRRWRTVLVGGLREGGVGYYAVDVTQPDQLKSSSELDAPIPEDGGSSNWVPRCIADYSEENCGPSKYGSVMWEFADTTDDSKMFGTPPATPWLMDEDKNGVHDLGAGWSTPNLGRIRVCRQGGFRCVANPVDPVDGSDVVDMYVAIFGGGLDAAAADKTVPARGEWIYMVDIETGKVVYKRRLCSPYSSVSCLTPGSVAAEPAAVDTDLDGYIDRLYVVTTGGFMYRADLGPAASGSLPPIVPVVAAALDPATNAPVDKFAYRVQRQNLDTGESFWEPRAIFDANWDYDPASTELAASPYRRPLYQRPTVFFAALLDRFGVAFGTGNREDLWQRSFQRSRFYLFIDDTDELLPSALPLNESDLVGLGVDDADLDQDQLLLRPTGQKGWYLRLAEEERVITDAFALSGVTIFSSFQPAIAITESDCDPVNDPGCDTLDTVQCGSKTFETDTDNLCARAGVSRNFVVGTTNGDAFLYDVVGNATRYRAVSTFVTSPFSEPGQNKNSDSGPSTSNADTLSALDLSVMENLKQLFPENCKFANYRVDIKTIAADTRVERIAPIPVCVVEKNWKEY